MPYVELITSPPDTTADVLREKVTRQGTAGYREFTARVQDLVQTVFFATGWQAYTDVSTWNGQLQRLIQRYWRNAWEDGIKEFGLTMADLSAEELLALSTATTNDELHTYDFVKWVSDNRWETERPQPPVRDPERDRWRPDGLKSGLYSKVESRMRLWWNAYHRVQNEARQLAAGDRPMTWVLGPTEQHCIDCSTYAGRVYRASTWAKYDIRPQHSSLSCHGFNCLCRLQITDQRVTPGRPPRMTG